MVNREINIPEPEDRDSFIHEWDEIKYLNEKMDYWFTYRQDKEKAKQFYEKLKKIVLENDEQKESILGVDSLLMLARFEGNIEKEIYYNKLSINLVTKLLNLGEAVDPYTWEDVLDSMELLATLYEENGQRDKALAIVEECFELSKKHNLHFDEEGLKKTILEDN
jgi:tetratricopeptide (TPR) repeat protein